MSGYHAPVLLEEIKKCFEPIKAGTVVDGTVGGGGHAAALLSQSPGLRVIGLDKDSDAMRVSRESLGPFKERAVLVRRGYEALPEILDQMQLAGIEGALLDLGISSFQVDEKDRGFSYSKEGPLDMRFGNDSGTTAEEVVNGYSGARLEEIFRSFGEEKRSSAVAHAVVHARARGTIKTTGELARLVASVCRGSVKSAARIFQALRIEVNGELDALKKALALFPALISPGGRFAIISYHSLEDRLVKRRFSALTHWVDRGAFRLPGDDASKPEWEQVHKGALCPSEAEVVGNPRARSAKLRIIEKKWLSK